jgi:tryptophan halogenase
MKLCIVGTGAAGWMACAAMATKKDIFDEIVIIGSPRIPSIGVGESNTLKLVEFHKNFGVDADKFIRESDAAVKYGVYYQNWSKNNFIHHFKSNAASQATNLPGLMFLRLLANKPKEESIDNFVACNLNKVMKENNVFETDMFYPKSWHFDAGKYIEFISKHCKKFKHVSLISETVTKVEKSKHRIQKLVTDKNTIVEADYYIVATGYNDILNEEYVDLSDVLLTDKAFVYPLEYTNKREQFHPYTVAKTMKNGWRWITPTYSRIGTGYTFSSRHVSIDEARQEFINDVGSDIEPKLVDFYPRYNKKTFHENYCTLGLSNGFLEPLDAPGLSLTINTIYHLSNVLQQQKDIPDDTIVSTLREVVNQMLEGEYKFWAAFILTQYKTCWRDDTQFWIDHKNVEYGHQKYIMTLLGDISNSNPNHSMFMHTIAAKDCTWDSELKAPPFKQPEYMTPTIHHLDYVDAIRKNKLSRSGSIHTMV